MALVASRGYDALRRRNGGGTLSELKQFMKEEYTENRHAVKNMSQVVEGVRLTVNGMREKQQEVLFNSTHIAKSLERTADIMQAILIALEKLNDKK